MKLIMDTLSDQDITDISASYGRCCISDVFFDRFYAIFLASNPIVAGKFNDTDMTKQKVALRHGLTTLIMFAKGMGTAEDTLKKVAISHSKSNYDIAPELYPYWINSLIQAIKEVDGDKFTPELEKKWRICLNIGLNYLASLY